MVRVLERDGLAILECDRCEELCGSRRKIVNGSGPRRAKVAVIGQAPGREEDRRGRPFIGPAGTTLRQWLRAAKLNPDEDVYYTNATRCMGPLDADGKERAPNDEEIGNCRDFLLEELAAVDPDVIVPAGAIALQSLYEKAPITQLRGAVIWHEELGRKMIPILHPASAFHVWSNEQYGIADLKKACKEAEEPDGTYDGLGQYEVCLDVESVEDLADLIEREAELLAFDTETTSLDWQTGKVLCVGVSWEPGTAYVVPVRGLEAKEYWPPAKRKRVMAALRRIFGTDIQKVGQNGRFDQLFLGHDLGIEVKNYAFDTMLAYHLFHEEAGHALDTLCNLYTNMGDYSREARPYKKNMASCPLEIIWKYQAADADCTLRVALVLDEMLDAEPDLRWVFENITIPLSVATMHMEENGVLVDRERADKLVETYDDLVAVEKKKLYAIPEVPEGFNYRSDNQKRALLFETLNLPRPSIVTAKKKLPSTKREALEEIGVGSHPVIPVLIRLTALEQIMKTFLEGAIKEKREQAKSGLLNRISKVDKRLHTNYRVDGTKTGRLSASPNIQNIAGEGKSEAGAPIRDIFIAPPGRVLLIADFSQIELRGMAYIAEDMKLIDMLEGGVDIHDFVARQLFDIAEDVEVTKEERRQAKTFNFGLGYGMTEEALSRRLGCSKARARELLAMYLGIVEKLGDYFATQRRAVKNRGIVYNIFGRRRLFWGVQSMRHFGGYKRQMGHVFRESYNYPIQSSASDIHSLATIAVDQDEWLRENEVYLVASIHDSVMLEVRKEQAEEVARHVQVIMARVATEVTERVGRPWLVPVDVEVGPRWERVTHKLTTTGEWKKEKDKKAA